MTIGHVDVRFDERVAVVTTDLRLARGAWSGGDVELFVAYGAPGVPRSFSAGLVALEPGRLLPTAVAEGAPLTTRHARARPATARLALGPSGFAGQVVTLPAGALAAALTPSGLAAVRLRAEHVLPSGATPSVVVRIATTSGSPLALGAVTARGRGPHEAATAIVTPCTPPDGGEPLVLDGRGPPTRSPARAPRRASDDLCVHLATPPRGGRH